MARAETTLKITILTKLVKNTCFLWLIVAQRETNVEMIDNLMINSCIRETNAEMIW